MILFLFPASRSSSIIPSLFPYPHISLLSDKWMEICQLSWVLLAFDKQRGTRWLTYQAQNKPQDSYITEKYHLRLFSWCVIL